MRNARTEEAVKVYSNFNDIEKARFSEQTGYSESFCTSIMKDECINIIWTREVLNFTMDISFEEMVVDDVYQTEDVMLTEDVAQTEALEEDFENICNYSHRDAQEAAANVLEEDDKYSY